MNLHLVTCAFGLEGKNLENVHIWAKSARRFILGSKITIFASGTNLSGIEDATIIPVEPEAGSPILTRWEVYRQHLGEFFPDDVLLLIDSRDVVFNGDPWPAIQERLQLDRPMFFSEHQTTASHAWCSRQAAIIERFSSGIHALDVPEINGGCIVGSPEVLTRFSHDMAWGIGLLAKCKMSDQPLINRWARQNAHVLMEDPGLYCHGELVKQGRWKADPRTSAIYHQFDRVPNHRAEYAAEYLTTAEPVPEKQFVIAHFREDMAKLGAWLPPDIPSVVYTKGEQLGAIQLENVGFEAHTFFHHFAANYHSLATVTICLQADPFDHFKKDAKAIRHQIEAIDPGNFSFTPLAPVGFGAVQGRDGSPHHHAIAGDLERLWRELLGYPPPERWFSWYAAQFAVHRDLVTRRPREWWQKGADLIRTKHMACAAERAWGAIFS